MKPVIVKYSDQFKGDVEDICYKTGYMGDSLEGRNIFNDRRLFSHLFCNYYLEYEKDNCFIAVNSETESAIGYIIGTTDTQAQEKDFIVRYLPKIILRLFTVSLFKYYESFKATTLFVKYLTERDKHNKIHRDYPAHLHMNILPDYQHLGVGSMLLNEFEEHLSHLHIHGLHLVTTSLNLKAIPFYKKKGFKVLKVSKAKIWRDCEQCSEIIFGKQLMENNDE